MKRKFHSLIWIAGSLALLAILPLLPEQVARAQNPAAVELSGFTAAWDSLDDTVVLSWTTATEFEAAGFQIRRINAVSRPSSTDELDTIVVTTLDDEDFLFIPAAGEGASGATYTVIDYTMDPDESYWYYLVEIDLSGESTVFDGVDGADFARQVWTMDATPTPTPPSLATPTRQPTQTVAPTATPTATPNSQITATASPESSQTPAANSTSTPTPRTSPTPTGATATATSQPTATRTGSSFSGPTPTPFRFSDNDGDEGDEVAQVDATPDPYPAPADEGGDDSYPGGEPPLPEADPNATATPYPLDAAPTGPPADINAATIGGNGYDAPSNTIGNGATTTSAALGDGQPAGSSQSLLLWAGFIVALLIFAGGVFGSVVLFTRRRAP